VEHIVFICKISDRLCSVFQFNRKGIKVEEMAQPTCWQLVKATPKPDVGEIHEIVLTLQGALAEKKFPSFNKG